MEASKAMKLTQLLMLVALSGPAYAHAGCTLVNHSGKALELVLPTQSLSVAVNATVVLPSAFLNVSVDVHNLSTGQALPFIFTDATVLFCIDHVSLIPSLAVDICLGSLVDGIPVLYLPLTILSAHAF